MKSRCDCNCPCHSGGVVVHPVPCCDGILGDTKKKPGLYCNFEFPLYVCLDDGEVIRIEAPDRILYHLEAIDIENNEYQFWEATGRPLKVVITNGQVSGLEGTQNKVTLVQAIQQYAEQLGVRINAGGKPEEIWVNLEAAKESLPRQRRLLTSRLQVLVAMGVTGLLLAQAIREILYTDSNVPWAISPSPLLHGGLLIAVNVLFSCWVCWIGYWFIRTTIGRERIFVVGWCLGFFLWPFRILWPQVAMPIKHIGAFGLGTALFAALALLLEPSEPDSSRGHH